MGGLYSSEWDDRDREIARLVREFEKILGEKLHPNARAAFEQALVLQFGAM